MARTTTTITFSLSPDLAEQVEQTTKRQGCTRSEFLRRAVSRYIEECEWRQVLRYGQDQARMMGIGPENVESLVEEYRAEVGPNRA